jgi:ABC-type dipeptide/oligopeptide/nickel transport system ATPase component
MKYLGEKTMRWTKILTVLAIAIIGSVVIFGNNSQFHSLMQKYAENGEIVTLESRFSPEQIMRLHEEILLPNKKYAFQDPSLKFHPYLFMDVKYTQANGKTKEGIILWSMVDGEMVVDADTWEMTHGFNDAILADASRNDMVILKLLSEQKEGKMGVNQLQKALNVEPPTMEKMISQATEKYLITQRGNIVSLHFENPTFNIMPLTRINQRLVTKPYNHAKRAEIKYNKNQIERIAKAAFGKDFSIRSSQEVFLPVYNIDVLNPDGSHMISQWNALTGQQTDSNQYIQTK